MLKKYERYDYRVQLMRIFACFIVIGCHVRLEPVINGGLDKELLLLHGFYDDGVAIFFMVIGFFLPAIREPFWKYVGKTFLHILIPVFFLMLSVQLLAGWILSDPAYISVSIWQALSEIFGGFVSLNFIEGSVGSPVWGMTSHLWYITSYLRLALVLPLLRLFALDNPLSSKSCRWFLAVSIAGMLINDMRALFPAAFVNVGRFAIFEVSAVYAVIGYVIYQKQQLFKNSMKYRCALLAGMVAINILRFILQCILFSRSLDDNYFYFWNTSVSLVFAVCFIGFFLTFPKGAVHPVLNVLNYIGTKTFFIYLIHMAVYTFMDHRGIRDMVYSFTVWASPNILTKFAYDVIYPAIVFLVCLALAVCFDFMRSALKRLLTASCQAPGKQGEHGQIP